jgi:hypothetical protein
MLHCRKQMLLYRRFVIFVPYARNKGKICILPKFSIESLSE